MRTLNLVCKVFLILILFTSTPVYIQSITIRTDMSRVTKDSTIAELKFPLSQEPAVNRDFWTCNLDTGVHYEVAATLLTSGEYCHIYMQDSLIPQIGAVEAQSRCESYRDEFDTLIYPTVVDLTGNPDGLIGDIDGDPRIIILISDNLFSYYSQYNEIPHTYSNLCEMIYIYYNDYRILDTIAHEFCHLIWFNYEFDEVHFILEGLAEYATYQCGYLTSSNNESLRTSYFLENSDDSLVYFDVAPRDYGNSYLFTFYLAERFGVKFLTDLVQHEDDGAHGIETALDAAGYNISFNQLYLDWITALTINELGFEDDKYGFQDLDVTIEDPSVVHSIPFEIENLEVKCYGSRIFEIAIPTNGFAVETSAPSSGKIGLSIAYHDVGGWHVTQEVSTETITEDVNGINIDSAFIIISFFYSNTPSGEIDFGVGMIEDIGLSIHHYDPNNATATNTSSTDTGTFALLAVGFGSFGILLAVVALHIKKKGARI